MLWEKKKVGERLTNARVALGYTVKKQFADEVGISPQYLSDCESGRQRLSIEAALKIFERFEIDPNFFFLGKNSTLPHSIAMALSSMPRDK